MASLASAATATSKPLPPPLNHQALEGKQVRSRSALCAVVIDPKSKIPTYVDLLTGLTTTLPMRIPAAKQDPRTYDPLEEIDIEGYLARHPSHSKIVRTRQIQMRMFGNPRDSSLKEVRLSCSAPSIPSPLERLAAEEAALRRKYCAGEAKS